MKTFDMQQLLAMICLSYSLPFPSGCWFVLLARFFVPALGTRFLTERCSTASTEQELEDHGRSPPQLRIHAGILLGMICGMASLSRWRHEAITASGLPRSFQ